MMKPIYELIYVTISVWVLSAFAGSLLGAEPDGVSRYSAEHPAESWAAIKAYESNAYFLPPFDATYGSMSPDELEKLRYFIVKVFDYYRDDLKNYINPPRFGFLIGKLGKTNFYCSIVLQAINLPFSPEYPLDPRFVANMRALYNRVGERAEKIIKEKRYTTSNLDKQKILQDTNVMLNYLEGVLRNSPVGIYLQWNWLEATKNLANPEHLDSQVDRLEELADLTAKLKVIDYFSQLDMIKWVYERAVGAVDQTTLPMALQGSTCAIPIIA